MNINFEKSFVKNFFASLKLKLVQIFFPIFFRVPTGYLLHSKINIYICFLALRDDIFVITKLLWILFFLDRESYDFFRGSYYRYPGPKRAKILFWTKIEIFVKIWILEIFSSKTNIFVQGGICFPQKLKFWSKEIGYQFSTPFYTTGIYCEIQNSNFWNFKTKILVKKQNFSQNFLSKIKLGIADFKNKIFEKTQILKKRKFSSLSFLIDLKSGTNFRDSSICAKNFFRNFRILESFKPNF